MEEIQWKARILFVIGGKPAVVVPRFENQSKAVVNGTYVELKLKWLRDTRG
jgi:hypothetical protein